MSSNTPVQAKPAIDQPLAAPVAFASTQGRVDEENECCVSNFAESDPVKLNRVHFSVKIWGSVVLSLLLLALLAPLCHNTKSSAVIKGMKGRRLAGGESTDEEDGPGYAYLEELCAALGAWAPSEGLPEGQRASPGLVDEVLATLEEGVAESASLGISGISGDASVDPARSGLERILPASTSSLPSSISGEQRAAVIWSTLEGGPAAGAYLMPPQASGDAPAFELEQLSRKRHRPEHAGDEEPCPRGKTQRLEWPPHEFVRPPEAPQQWGLELSPQAALGHPSRIQVPSIHSLPQGVAPHETADPSYHAGTPSTFVSVTYSQQQASPARPQTLETYLTDWEEKHPYVRIPVLVPGVVPRPLNVDKIFETSGPRRHCYLLREVREIFVNKPLIVQHDAAYLVHLAEQLANHLFNRMSTDVGHQPAFMAVNLLGRRFMVYDALYSISAALDVNWPLESWWRILAEKVPSEVDISGYFSNTHTFYIPLIEDLTKALRLFKSGLRPSEELLISIKRRLFCDKLTTYYMKERSWDAWREDDKHS